MELKDKKIGVLCGGISNEREVSLRSGKNVYTILKEASYDVVLLDLENKNDLRDLLTKNNIEIVFNTLHGLYGEDGGVQNDLDILGIPYTGCDVHASAMSINKHSAKLIARGLEIPTAKYVLVQPGAKIVDVDIPFNYPYFVKPIDEGSSQDTYIIHNQEDAYKIELNPNKMYLLEEFIEGTEVTAGIISVHFKEHIKLPILQLLSSNEFYDYEAKYTAGKTQFVCPAELSEELANKIQEYSLEMHKALWCDGATRCDFLIDKTGVPYFLELNSSPGMTELSDIPIEAKAYGWSSIQLCEKILQSAKVKK